MTPLLMRHKVHGAHYVYNEWDAKRHEKMGWVRPENFDHQPPPAQNNTLTLPKKVK